MINPLKSIVARIKRRRFNRANSEIIGIKAKKLTYLSTDSLLEMKATVAAIEREKIAGMFIEAGCALGGSAILIGMTKNRDRRFGVYDVFGMIPEPSEKDGVDVHERYKVIREGKSTGIGGDEYYGYQEDLLEKVRNNFLDFGLDPEAHNIEFVKGLFQDTLKIQGNVAFAHIDCDWYESVTVCLEQIVPRLSVGGKLIIDDYNDWSGCKSAIDDYFKEMTGNYKFTHRSKLQIERIK